MDDRCCFDRRVECRGLCTYPASMWLPEDFRAYLLTAGLDDTEEGYPRCYGRLGFGFLAETVF